jgi:(1->4)-alpha-D-glucan 1-alpha-D-glucosylmutase
MTGETRDFERIAHESKLEQARTTFQQEAAILRRLLDVPGIEDALAALHVYRTYIEAGRRAEPEDVAVVEGARLAPAIAEALLGDGDEEFTSRFQQTSGPVMAKGIEDTAFYRYFRLTALNEVGGDPGRFSLSVEEFHRGNLERARRFPRHLLASQTHDTKRAGDVRARIGALATMPEEWGERVERWHALNAPLREGAGPDPNEEYLIYQTLVGAWPLEQERLEAYLEKALREGKRNTNWLEPNEAWEEGVRAFVRGLYRHEPFLEDFEDFVEMVVEEGERAALGQLVLRLTVPGVPDVYQGDELEALNLVDPDNRRPVHWELRRRLLDELRSGARPTRQTQKLYVLWQALALRARRPATFESGEYVPLEAGPDTVAFRRGDEVSVIVPLRAGGQPDLSVLGGGDWENVIQGLPFFLGERR